MIRRTTTQPDDHQPPETPDKPGKALSALYFLGLCLVCLSLLVLAVMTVPALKNRVRGRLQRAGLLAPPLPTYIAPIAPPERITARRLLVATLHDALARQDYAQAATLNATLSQEAFQRAYHTLKAWEGVRDPETGLVPHATSSFYNDWDSEDVAADLFPHLLIASHYLDLDNRASWDQALTNERQICGAMACRIELDSGRVVEQDLDTRIFGTSEYAKDGLLAITERFGPGPWLDRMVEGVDAILDAAYVETQVGLIPSNGTEANGELLQVLTRLYWASGDERYLQMAERIGEAYLFGMLPHNQGLPADYWDFEAQKPLQEDKRFRPIAESGEVNPFRLVDHGGEIIPGLTELYFLEKLQDRPQADRYRQPLQQLLEKLLLTGRSDEGLWYKSIDVSALAPLDENPADTWGYILNGFHTFDLAEGSDHYAAEIERAMRAVTTKHSHNWEGDWQDGYADSIESMLYLLPWFDIPACHYWVDDEIEVMFLKQRSDGFVEEWYLDGNFVRTALLYAQYKTQGLYLAPWQESIRVGAALDREADTLYVHLAAQQDWQGRLRFDMPRHRAWWNLPFEYPRLNGSPQWYVVEPENTYTVTNLDTGETDVYAGQDLIEGLPITLDGSQDNTLNLMVSLK
jgi:hypothetical protein